MKWVIVVAACYALIGVLTVACAGYREGFRAVYGREMMTPQDMVFIFIGWPIAWIGFGGTMLYAGVVTVLEKAVRRPAQKIGEVHKTEWETRRSAIREVDRLLGGK